MDQSVCIADSFLRIDVFYDAVSPFWSDKGGAKLQITGLPCHADAFNTAGTDTAFLVHCTGTGRLVCEVSSKRG